jgi:hypothetical protein
MAHQDPHTTFITNHRLAYRHRDESGQPASAAFHLLTPADSDGDVMHFGASPPVPVTGVFADWQHPQEPHCASISPARIAQTTSVRPFHLEGARPEVPPTVDVVVVGHGPAVRDGKEQRTSDVLIGTIQ